MLLLKMLPRLGMGRLGDLRLDFARLLLDLREGRRRVSDGLFLLFAASPGASWASNPSN